MSHQIYFRIVGYVITVSMHVSNIIIMIGSFHGEPMKNHYVRHFSEMQCFFFTCWTFVFQTIYAIFGLSTDILTLKNSRSPKYEPPRVLVDSRDAIFSVLVWPSTVLVFTMFWSFFYYDRSLLFPADVDLVISSTSNHIMHTYILPATLWEVMFRSRRPPKSHKWHVLGVWMLAVVYFRVLFMVHAVRGVWVYPLFGVMSGSILFYLFVAMLFSYLPIIYYAQWTLNSVIHGGREKKMMVN
ncbi:hypothetical protein PYW07_011715 [Mythimna separata]|uniref:Androgen-dependent TFPI-regulating protein-like n=1 Tax=Mythimna separata TaxID=271217 RepID=A0AAD8DJU2_MYTSE|nr:hypothetical protein PYW07_011715 [Mythimna separata]